MMQGVLIACILIILSFVSPCLCLKKWNLGLEIEESTFNVMNYGAKGDGKSEDSNAFLSAWNETCNAQGNPTLVIPQGNVFLLKNLELNGPCKAPSIHIQVLGDIVAPSKDEWGDDKKPLITISKVNSLIMDGGGHIEGNGNTWWKICNKDCERPGLLRFSSCNDLSVTDLNLANSPGFHIAINSCENVKFLNMNINAPSDSPNTDGFDISSSKSVVFEDSTITTGDDCIAINGGCSFINATRLNCGPGHGISVGSLGKNNAHETVEEVHVKNCTFNGTKNGARIKTWEGGSGYVRKVTYENIILINSGNPIIIDQHYGAEVRNNDTESLEISDVTFQGFEGTSANEKAIELDCCKNGCRNLILDHINILSSDQIKKAQTFCNNAYGRAVNVIPDASCLLG